MKAINTLKQKLLLLLETLNRFGMITSVPTEVTDLYISREYANGYLKQRCHLTFRFKVRSPTGEHLYTLIETGSPEEHCVYYLEHPTGFQFRIYQGRGGLARDQPMYNAVDCILDDIELSHRRFLKTLVYQPHQTP